MTYSYPLLYTWDGDSMITLPAFQAKADERFVIGETYRLEEVADRSAKSHSHFFASVSEVWDNLPVSDAMKYPTPDHLRKRALIRTGYCDERSIVCSSRAEALRLASFVGQFDDCAMVVPRAAVVTVYTATSQSQKAMGAKVFQKSKDDVLGYLAGMIGVTADQLQVEAGRSI